MSLVGRATRVFNDACVHLQYTFLFVFVKVNLRYSQGSALYETMNDLAKQMLYPGYEHQLQHKLLLQIMNKIVNRQNDHSFISCL